MRQNKVNIPTILVVFGATGDLVKKKILPALFNLFLEGKLPTMFKVVGFSRRSFSREDFEKYIFEATAKYRGANAKICGAFCKPFSYQQGVFEKLDGFRALEKRLLAIDNEWGVCANKLFYLAVPPKFYKTIFKKLAASGLTKPCSPEEGWSRVLVEKPFGKDLETAKKLDTLLGALFKEEQIYRIDHYLAKEMLQNILAFRFSNNLFENSWDNTLIEKITIRLWEKIGVEDRGGFYDSVGALQDVGQNHFLEMLALITMENPTDFNDRAIREKRRQALETLVPPSAREIKKFSFRAQYAGYRTIEGVAPNSRRETYFKIRAFLDSPRWRGVPTVLEGGKRLKEQRKEIVVWLKHPTPCLCPKDAKDHYQNKIVFTLEPQEGVTFELWRKRPGLAFEIERKDCLCSFREEVKMTQYTEEYEKLLYDCIVGDQTLFASSGEVEVMWRFIDPIVKAWKKSAVPLNAYEPDSDQPMRESRWIDEGARPAREHVLKKEIAIVGLGKMGANIARRLMQKNWRVFGFNLTPDETNELEKEGLLGLYSLTEIVEKLSRPRIVWLMVPAGKPVDGVLFGKEGLAKKLKRGDTVIDGGNSFYKDSVTRSKKLNKAGIHFVDAGVSGGPQGALEGASLMVGGERKRFEKLEPLFADLAQENGYQFFEGAGAGHFVKMVHNGIEYGMMQAIAEGFTILKKSKYKLDLTRIADVYNHGSVIESRLVEWLKNALEMHGEDLKDVSGAVGHTGEGEWTVKTAKELKVKAKILEGAMKFRVASEKNPGYTGKILSALREQFGGHSAKIK